MKIINASEAAALIKDGDTVSITGLVGAGFAEYVALGIEERFKETEHPRDLTLLFASGVGNTKPGPHGANIFAHKGMLKRVITGHYQMSPELQEMVKEDAFEAYLFPQDTITQNYRESAAGRPGVITKTGLGTFADPRLDGGKCSPSATEDLVELIELGGEEYLWYKPYHVDVAVIRATSADEYGNLGIEKESILLNQYYLAALAKKSGGIVIAQVERFVQGGSMDPRKVFVPGILVDYVVQAPAEHHWQTYAAPYDPALAQAVRIPASGIKAMPMSERKIVARRACLELEEGDTINLGIGLPVGVGQVTAEEGISDKINLCVETGHIRGIPANGLAFGGAYNPEFSTEILRQFDFYNGGGLKKAFLGAAEFDLTGNVNVSKVGKIIGPGGFIGIAQYTKTVIFCSTFTGGGLKVSVADGKLNIDQEGKIRKVVPTVEHITFSGDIARKTGQKIVYITERCVFEITDEGIMLTEVAPGIDLQTQVLDLIDGDVKVSPDLKTMDERIFREEPMGLTL